MKYIRTVILGLMALAVLIFIGEAIMLMRDLRLKTLPQLTQAATDLDRSEIIIGASATSVEKSLRSWKDQSSQQAIAATKATEQLNSDLVDLGGLLSTAQSTLQTQSTSLTSFESEATQSLQRVDPILENLTKASASLSSEVGNPEIAESIASIHTSTDNLAKATADGAATLKDAHAAADYELAQLEKPVKKIKVVLDFVLHSAGKFLGY